MAMDIVQHKHGNVLDEYSQYLMMIVTVQMHKLKSLNAFPTNVNLPFSYLHAAACQTESSKGEGKAEPRFSQQAVWRYDKVGPEHLEEPPSNTEHK